METVIGGIGRDMAELRKQNKNLVNRVELLESSENINIIKSRIKRAAKSSNPPATPVKKCLSRFYEYPDMKKPTGSSNIVPNSCDDLQIIGHTLNGFYSVQGRDENTNRIETIFCNFSEISTKTSDFTQFRSRNWVKSHNTHI